MPSRNNQGLLARVNFPLYTLQMLTSRHVIVGGGGGSSKTGVANGFEIFELSYNGSRFVVEEMMRHETGPSVVMNCACISTPKRIYLVAGQESHCQLYTVSSEIVSRNRNSNSFSTAPNQKKDGNVRRRTTSKSKSPNESAPLITNENKKEEKIKPEPIKRHLEFHIKPADSIQTDFGSESLQRVVRISPSGQLMATGGTDGHVRLWHFPSLKPAQDITAHHREIDDLDFSPDSNQVVSVSKDGKGYIWCVKTGNKSLELQWTPTNGTKYLYKRCRYGRVEEDPRRHRLFLICNPVSRVGKQQAFIQLWQPASEGGQLVRSASVAESLSALAVRDDGRFVAVGTMFTGTVDVYIAFSLQRVLSVPEAHGMFVTGLEFLPAASDESSITTVSEAAVISISVDNKVCIHNLPYRYSLPRWLVVILIIVTLFFAFAFCSFVGL